MAVSNTGHSTDNYYEGKGIVYLAPVGTAFNVTTPGASWRDIGNVPVFSIAPTVEKRDHYSSRAGKRTKDKTWVIEQGGTIRMVMEDFNAANLALVLMGTPVAGVAPADNEFTVEIFKATELEFALMFIGKNDIGPKCNILLPKISFTPQGELGFISDEQGQIEVNAEVLGVDTAGVYDYGSLIWNPYVA